MPSSFSNNVGYVIDKTACFSHASTPSFAYSYNLNYMTPVCLKETYELARSVQSSSSTSSLSSQTSLTAALTDGHHPSSRNDSVSMMNASPSGSSDTASTSTMTYSSDSPNFRSAYYPCLTLNAPCTLFFNVPLQSHLNGPDLCNVLFSSQTALQKWMPVESLLETGPRIHQDIYKRLCSMAEQITLASLGKVVVTVNRSKRTSVNAGLLKQPRQLTITNVSVNGNFEACRSVQAQILSSSSVSLQCLTVDIDGTLILNNETGRIKSLIAEYFNEIAEERKCDIFIHRIDATTWGTGLIASSVLSNSSSMGLRLRCSIYGEMPHVELAKIRVLVLIDQLLHRKVDVIRVDQNMHNFFSRASRKAVKRIESDTDTAIFFPPPFSNLFTYDGTLGANESDNEIIITSLSLDGIAQAKQRLQDLAAKTGWSYTKEISVPSRKIRRILLERLDDVRKIMENSGSYISLPGLDSCSEQIGIRVSDVNLLNKVTKDVVALTCQFYCVSWQIPTMATMATIPGNGEPVTQHFKAEILSSITNICINADVEIVFDQVKHCFHFIGSDDAMKLAMKMMSTLGIVKSGQSFIQARLELANEHREFVSGKKNGKIVKVMNASKAKIVTESLNEFNFVIDIRATNYESMERGINLVELEMPVSISFHIPDQYHKRIIGIGGHHIQRIMKKYSVFVKFSNAQSRGNFSLADDAQGQTENVVCRTPTRNAQNLDLVKQEIMTMVEQVDADWVTEQVTIDRLFHRTLLSQMKRIEYVQRKWNCKIDFPRTERASDTVTVSGPEYQVPQAIDALLQMVPECHYLSFGARSELVGFLLSWDFQQVTREIRDHFFVDVSINDTSLVSSTGSMDKSADGRLSVYTQGSSFPSPLSTSSISLSDTECTSEAEVWITLTLRFTRNNVGELRDAIDFLVAKLAGYGVDSTQVRGIIPPPPSDPFEQFLPFFASKLLHPAEHRDMEGGLGGHRLRDVYLTRGHTTQSSSVLG